MSLLDMMDSEARAEWLQILALMKARIAQDQERNARLAKAFTPIGDRLEKLLQEQVASGKRGAAKKLKTAQRDLAQVRLMAESAGKGETDGTE